MGKAKGECSEERTVAGLLSVLLRRRPVDLVAHACALMPRAALELVDLLDEEPDRAACGAQLVARTGPFEADPPGLQHVHLLTREHRWSLDRIGRRRFLDTPRADVARTEL